MSSVGSGYTNTSRRSYISTAPFDNDFFNYVFTDIFPVGPVGDLLAVTGADASTCPAGRVLKEVGRKLYPGVDAGVSTYLVKVYDDVTFLSGFIDPNSPVFAVYNTDKPNTAGGPPLSEGIDPTGGLDDAGPPVYTNGSVQTNEFLSTGTYATIGTNLTVQGHMQSAAYISTGTSVTAGTTVSANGNVNTGGYVSTTTGLVSASGQNRVALVTNYILDTGTSGAQLNINASLGQVFNIFISSTNGVKNTNCSVNATPDGTNRASGSLSTLSGAQIYTIFRNTCGASNNVTLGSQVRESTAGNINLPIYSNAGNNVCTVGWICDGVSFFETTRTYNAPG